MLYSIYCSVNNDLTRLHEIASKTVPIRSQTWNAVSAVAGRYTADALT